MKTLTNEFLNKELTKVRDNEWAIVNDFKIMKRYGDYRLYLANGNIGCNLIGIIKTEEDFKNAMKLIGFSK